MKIRFVVKGGGYDGLTHFQEVPNDSRFKQIESLGIRTADGRVANFPVISISRKKIVLDGEKLTWEILMQKIPVFFQGGTMDGKTGTFDAEKEINIYTLKGGKLTLGDVEFPVLDVSTCGLLLDASQT